MGEFGLKLFFKIDQATGFWRKQIGVLDNGRVIDPSMKIFSGCDWKGREVSGVVVDCREFVENNVLKRYVFVDRHDLVAVVYVEKRKDNMPLVKIDFGDGRLDYVFEKKNGFLELRVDYIDESRGLRVFVARFFVICVGDRVVVKGKLNEYNDWKS